MIETCLWAHQTEEHIAELDADGFAQLKKSFYSCLCTPYMYNKYCCIFGLTGSVGGEAERAYIRKTYGAEVVGISGQGVESKQKFANELGLTFSILADEGDAVRKDFGVPKAAFGLFPGRVTYVLDQSGDCVLAYDDLVDAESHIDKAVEALEGLKSTSKSGAGNPFASIFGN